MAWPVLALMVFIVVGAPAHSAVAGSDAARAAIKAAYAQRTAAWDRRDIKGFMASYSGDFVSIQFAGRSQDYPKLYDWAHQVLSQPGKASAISAAWSVQSIAVAGDTAQVTVRESIQYAYPNKAKPTAYYYHETLLAALWQKTPLGWREHRDTALLDRTTWSSRPLAPADLKLPMLSGQPKAR